VPPIVGFAGTSKKDTIRNLEETGEFVWNLVSRDLAEQMNATAAHVAADVDEFRLAGVTPVPSKLVGVPRVGESRVAFECKVTQLIELHDTSKRLTGGWLALGEVVAVHIDRRLIRDGVYQTALGVPIVRAGRRGDYFTVKQEDMFEMIRPD
jgi:flavin reductase (DIM6/NTAB) family NADH-FMN oxidoreductase RutF